MKWILALAGAATLLAGCSETCTLEGCEPEIVLEFEKAVPMPFAISVEVQGSTVEYKCPQPQTGSILVGLRCGTDSVAWTGTELGKGEVPIAVTVKDGNGAVLVPAQQVKTKRVPISNDECHQSCTLRKGTVAVP